MALVDWALALRLTGAAPGRDHRDDPRLHRRRHGLAPARRRPHRAAVRLGPRDAPHPQPVRQLWADGWPFFRIASVLGTGFLPHRATTLGLPGLVAVVLLVATCLDRRPAGVLLAGVLAALLAPFQFYAFPATYLIVAAVRPDDRAPGARRRVGATRSSSSAPLVLAIPFIADAVVRQRDVGAFKLRDRLERGALRAGAAWRPVLLRHQPRPARSRWRSSRRRPHAASRRAGSSWPGWSRCS